MTFVLLKGNHINIIYNTIYLHQNLINIIEFSYNIFPFQLHIYLFVDLKNVFHLQIVEVEQDQVFYVVCKMFLFL